MPGVVTGTPKLTDYGTYRRWTTSWSSPTLPATRTSWARTRSRMGLYYVDELATDLWASIDAAMDTDTDPATVNCTVNPDTARVFQGGRLRGLQRRGRGIRTSGTAGPTSARRSSAPAATAMWSPPAASSSSGRIRASIRAWPPFGTLLCAAPGGHPVLQARLEDVHVRGQEGLLPDARPPGADRGEAPLRVRRGGAGRRGEPLRLRAVHGRSRSATTTSRSCPATGPAPAAPTRSRSPARSRRGQRRDPDARAERRFDPVRLCVRPAADHGRPERVPS